MAIPQGSNNFSPFLRLPNPLENKDGEIKPEAKVLIISELQPPETEKIKSPLIGEVELTNGERRTIGINWTSYYLISKIYGQDTKDWVGKYLVYHGLKKMDKGTGHLWTAEI